MSIRHLHVRRGDEIDRRPGHAHTGPGSPSERVRRTFCPDSESRVPGLGAKLIRGERHLDRVLREFVTHYN
jgi:hypothetical protein